MVNEIMRLIAKGMMDIFYYSAAMTGINQCCPLFKYLFKRNTPLSKPSYQETAIICQEQALR